MYMSYSYCNWYSEEADLGERYDEPRFSFIQGLLEWPFSELFFFWCTVFSYKMLIITGISNETRNEWTIYATLCQNVAIFYRQELASLFQVQEKVKTCRDSKWNFSSSCLQKTVIWKLHIVV